MYGAEGRGRRAEGEIRPAHYNAELIHVVVHGEDVVEALLVGVEVDHPAENDGVEAAAGSGAGVFGDDGAMKAEFGPVGGAELIARRHAEIGVEMPHSDAERDASVELIFRGALGHGVHGADEFIVGGGFFVEERSGASGIEGQRFQKAVAIAGEVIFGLRDIRQENFEAVVESGVVVLVFFDAGAELRDDFVGAFDVGGSLRAHAGHEHVVTVRVVVAGRHVLDGRAFVGFFVAHGHVGHGWGFRSGGFLSGGALRVWPLDGGRMVAGHGDEQDSDHKDGAQKHAGFRGEMKQRSTR
jgi:hypothetical protein